MSIRYRILSSIKNDPLTAEEMSVSCQEERKRIVSNIGPMCNEKMVERQSGLDGTVEYRITPIGLSWLRTNDQKTIDVEVCNTPINQQEDSRSPTFEALNLLVTGACQALSRAGFVDGYDSLEDAIDELVRQRQELADKLDKLSVTPEIIGYAMPINKKMVRVGKVQTTATHRALSMCRRTGKKVPVYALTLVGEAVPGSSWEFAPGEIRPDAVQDEGK